MPERFGLGITNCRPTAQVVSGVQEAERAGAEIAFVAEDIGCRDSFVLLAQCALKTDRIRLSTGVVNPFTRHPMSIAMSVATLDETSGGRACLGLGASSPALITGRLGIPSARSTEVMRDAARVVRALLTGQAVTYEGERLRVHQAKLEVPAQGTPIPIYFAAMGPQMLRLAGELADGVLLNVGASAAYTRWAVEQIRAGAESAGRAPSQITIAAWYSIYLSDDRPAALQRAREWLATMLSIPRQGELLLEHSGLDTSILPHIREHVSGYPHGGSPEAAAAWVPPEVAEVLAIVGTAHEVRTRLDEYRAVGVDIPVLSLPAIRALYPKE